MSRYLISFFLFVTLSSAETITSSEYSEELEYEPSVDCLILQDENSIICKYETVRSDEEQSIIVQWLDPSGEISRSREMIVPAGHGSIYDYRYIKGRTLGTWTFKVVTNEKELTTNFELK